MFILAAGCGAEDPGSALGGTSDGGSSDATEFSDSAGALASAPGSVAASWDEHCVALTEFQSYGVETMIQQCRAVQFLEPDLNTLSTCDQRWLAWQMCLGDNDNDHAACETERVDAMSCQVCHEGDVDMEGADRVVFVDQQRCPSTPSLEDGTHAFPYCEVGSGFADASAAQPMEDATKVVVCPGVYRENVDQKSDFNYAIDAENRRVPTSQAPRVTVESVVAHHGVVSGSEDWSDGWTAENKTIALQNHVADFASGLWTLQEGAKLDGVTGPFGTTVEAVVTDTSSREVRINGQWGTGHWIFSVYVKPEDSSQVHLHFGGAQRSADYAIVLPAAGCEAGPHIKADGYGYEELDDGWFRVWVSSSLLNTGNKLEAAPYDALTELRITAGPSVTRSVQSKGVALWGPQLEQESTTSFRNEPDVYYPRPEIFEPAPAYVIPRYTRQGWTHDWGLVQWDQGCPAPAPIVRRGEQVFVDGLPLRQVLHEQDLRPGTFFLDDSVQMSEPASRWPASGECNDGNVPRVPSSCSKDDPCKLHIAPPLGTFPSVGERGDESSLTFDSVEVSERPQTLVMHDSKNWTVRGLKFQHAGGGKSTTAPDPANSPGDNQVQVASVMFIPVIGLQFTDNLVVDNTRVGLGVHGMIDVGPAVPTGDPRGVRVFGEGIALVRNEVSRNGLLGAGVFNAQELEITDDTYNENNWRGAAGNFRGSFVGAAKMGWLDGATIAGLTTSNNYGSGLWFDHYALDVDLIDYVAQDNEGKGLFVEACPDLVPSGYHGLVGGPAAYTVDIDNALIERNSFGVVGSDSAHVRLHDSIVGGNHDPTSNGAQVAWMWGHFRHAADEGSEPIAYVPNGPHDLSMHRNVFQTCGTDRFLSYSDTENSAPQAPSGALNFLSTLDSDCNVFDVDDSATLVSLESGACVGAAVANAGDGCAHGFYNSVFSALDPVTDLSIPTYALSYWRNFALTLTGAPVDQSSVQAPAVPPTSCASP